MAASKRAAQAAAALATARPLCRLYATRHALQPSKLAPRFARHPSSPAAAALARYASARRLCSHPEKKDGSGEGVSPQIQKKIPAPTIPPKHGGVEVEIPAPTIPPKKTLNPPEMVGPIAADYKSLNKPEKIKTIATDKPLNKPEKIGPTATDKSLNKPEKTQSTATDKSLNAPGKTPPTAHDKPLNAPEKTPPTAHDKPLNAPEKIAPTAHDKPLNAPEKSAPTAHDKPLNAPEKTALTAHDKPLNAPEKTAPTANDKPLNAPEKIAPSASEPGALEAALKATQTLRAAELASAAATKSLRAAELAAATANKTLTAAELAAASAKKMLTAAELAAATDADVKAIKAAAKVAAATVAKGNPLGSAGPYLPPRRHTWRFAAQQAFMMRGFAGQETFLRDLMEKTAKSIVKDATKSMAKEVQEIATESYWNFKVFLGWCFAVTLATAVPGFCFGMEFARKQLHEQLVETFFALAADEMTKEKAREYLALAVVQVEDEAGFRWFVKKLIFQTRPKPETKKPEEKPEPVAENMTQKKGKAVDEQLCFFNWYS